MAVTAASCHASSIATSRSASTRRRISSVTANPRRASTRRSAERASSSRPCYAFLTSFLSEVSEDRLNSGALDDRVHADEAPATSSPSIAAAIRHSNRSAVSLRGAEREGCSSISEASVRTARGVPPPRIGTRSGQPSGGKRSFIARASQEASRTTWYGKTMARPTPVTRYSGGERGGRPPLPSRSTTVTIGRRVRTWAALA